MRYLLIIVIFFGCTGVAYSQKIPNPDNITFIQDLAKNEKATLSDAVKLFTLQSGFKYTSFKSASEILSAKGLLPNNKYEESDPLRRGLLSFMTAKYLKLSDSLWFTLFKTERYAYSECVSANVMQPGGSEWDFISGSELIEVIGVISEREEALQ